MELAHRDGEELLVIHGTPAGRYRSPGPTVWCGRSPRTASSSAELVRRAGDDHAGRRLAEEGEVRPAGGAGHGRGGAEVDVGAEEAAGAAGPRRLGVAELGAAVGAAEDAALGQRHGEPALGAVVGALEQARLDGRAQLALQLDLEPQVHVGDAARRPCRRRPSGTRSRPSRRRRRRARR